MPIILQDYERLKFLGKGAFAQIYKVRHKDLGYIRAIKVLTEEVNEGEDDKVYKTFLRECSLLLRLGNGGHPNIIRIYQPRKIEGKALVEMDYIDGMTFESFVSDKKFVPVEEVFRFVREIGSALAYCHVDCYRYMMNPDEKDSSAGDLIRKYGVAHNDIHSNNIMKKDLDGSYVLLDFGLAIQNEKAVKSSSRGDGAAEYLPPEKWAGQRISNEKAVDIYGFGILIYQMLTGRVPFVLDPEEYRKDSLKTLNTIRAQHENERPGEILPLRKAAYEKVTGLSDYEQDYPEWLEELVYKCLEKKPENRFHDAKELLAFFDSHMQDDLSSADKTVESLKKANRALRQKINESGIRGNETERAVTSGKLHGTVMGLSILSGVLAVALAVFGIKYHNAKGTVTEEQSSEISRLVELVRQREREISEKDMEISTLKSEMGQDKRDAGSQSTPTSVPISDGQKVISTLSKQAKK